MQTLGIPSEVESGGVPCTTGWPSTESMISWPKKFKERPVLRSTESLSPGAHDGHSGGAANYPTEYIACGNGHTRSPSPSGDSSYVSRHPSSCLMACRISGSEGDPLISHYQSNSWAGERCAFWTHRSGPMHLALDEIFGEVVRLLQQAGWQSFRTAQVYVSRCARTSPHLSTKKC
jgi:hypothetical protein